MVRNSRYFLTKASYVYFFKGQNIQRMMSSRIQRWAILLSAYDYSIRYRPGRDLTGADTLSRLPLSPSPGRTPDQEITFCYVMLSIAKRLLLEY